jgi:hypothetical protein
MRGSFYLNVILPEDDGTVDQKSRKFTAVIISFAREVELPDCGLLARGGQRIWERLPTWCHFERFQALNVVIQSMHP